MANQFTREPEPHADEPAPVAATARCSPAQERYWEIDSRDPGTPALNIAVKWRIRGHLDASLAQEAFQAILDRHRSLRTAIRLEDGRPVQAISAQVPFKLPEIDLSGLPEADRTREADRIAQGEACTRFDLGQAPLLRATLLRKSRAEAVVLVVAHHIVSDGWSMGLIAKDFVAAYQALGRGREPVLPQLPCNIPTSPREAMTAWPAARSRARRRIGRTSSPGCRSSRYRPIARAPRRGARTAPRSRDCCRAR